MNKQTYLMYNAHSVYIYNMCQWKILNDYQNAKIVYHRLQLAVTNWMIIVNHSQSI